MLSKNQLVAVRRAIESTYTGVCTITENRQSEDEYGAITFEDVVIFENQPCRLSFASSPATKQNNSTATLSQTIKLFLAPELNISAGSKILVTQNGTTSLYKRSGAPAVYNTHQEIVLELAERRA